MSTTKLIARTLGILTASVIAAGHGVFTMPAVAQETKPSSKPMKQSPQVSFRVGEIVRSHFYVRNVGNDSMRIAVPRIITHSYYRKIRLTDANGHEIRLQQPEEPAGPVGWLASELGKGQHAELSGLNLSIGPPAANESVETVLPVQPGHTYRLQYTLDNYGDQKLGRLRTGEFTFAVVAKNAPKAKQPSAQKMEKHIAWGRPGRNDLQVGVLLRPVKDAAAMNRRR